jgi:anti-anti-sigma factor
LDGELEIGRRDEVRRALQFAGPEKAVLLDFSAVTYADSTALSELLRFRTEASNQGVALALLVTGRQLGRLLQYAGLDQAFAVFNTRAAALSYLADQRTT